MKTKQLYLIGSIIIIILVTIYLTIPKKEVLITKGLPTQQKSYSSAISMMYETEEGSGEYVVSKSNEWPQVGYTFNDKLSKCENGSTLSWDDEAKRVIMKGNTSDKCYVYFDKGNNNFANYIKSLYTGTQGENNIYYHKNLENSAEDESYRYAGAYEDVNNYVCFGIDGDTCDDNHLYRIIGVFDNQVKLIKADFATTAQLGTTELSEYVYKKTNYANYKGSLDEIPLYYWSGSSNSSSVNSWASSTLNTNALNKNFLGTFDTTWQSKIAITNWKVGGNIRNTVYVNAKSVYMNEITNPVTGQTPVNNKIGLIYLSDYMYGASPNFWTYVGQGTQTTDYRAAINANWMYSGVTEWTITRRSDDTTRLFYINGNGLTGDVESYVAEAIRPIFYLNSDIQKIGGNGTPYNPYIIK